MKSISKGLPHGRQGSELANEEDDESRAKRMEEKWAGAGEQGREGEASAEGRARGRIR